VVLRRQHRQDDNPLHVARLLVGIQLVQGVKTIRVYSRKILPAKKIIGQGLEKDS
jgi:hypothetical protein